MKRRLLQLVAGVLVALALVVGQVPGAVWADDVITATASVIGVDESGADAYWAEPVELELPEGSTAADLTVALFEQADLTADYGESTYGFYLNSITSPTDPGYAPGWDEATGKYWQLFVDGAASDWGADAVTVTSGMQVTWYYSAYGAALPELTAPEGPAEPEEPETPADPVTLSVAGAIYGADANGTVQVWAPETTLDLPKGSTAADLTVALFEQAGIEASYSTSEYGFYLESITSPFASDLVLSSEDLGGGVWAFWQLIVNGELASTGADGVVLEPGDVVTWVYGATGEVPDASEDLVIDPDAPRPTSSAFWPGFALGGTGSVVTDVATPTTGAALAWTYDLRGDSAWATASDPLIIDDDIYVVTGGKLVRIDGATGKLVASAPTVDVNSYFCRPIYAQGLVIVPSDTGALTAYTADTLTCVWRSATLEAPVVAGSEARYQALSALTVVGDRVVAGFTVPGGSAGALVCVNLADGSIAWSRAETSAETGEAEGYYWAAAAVSGSDLIIGTEAGTVELVDGATGAVLSRVSVGAAVRAGVIAAGTESGAPVFLAVSRDDGSLHKIVRRGDELELVASVSFAAQSTSTPAVSAGTVFVGGMAADGSGTLSLIDLATMTVARTVTLGAGAAQGAPLVSVVEGETYVYATCNAIPGGVYCYHVGDDAATTLFEPAGDLQQFCTASVIADASGSLYYANDSGTLFKLVARATVDDEHERPTDTEQDDEPIVTPQPEPSDTGSGAGTAGADTMPAPVATSQPSADAAGAEVAPEDAADADGSPAEATAEATGTATFARARAGAATSDANDAGVNYVAIAGIALGICGLVVAGYLMFGKRGERA